MITKDMYFEEIERIEDEFFKGEITLEEGIKELKRLGFDYYEAKEILEEVTA